MAPPLLLALMVTTALLLVMAPPSLLALMSPPSLLALICAALVAGADGEPTVLDNRSSGRSQICQQSTSSIAEMLAVEIMITVGKNFANNIIADNFNNNIIERRNEILGK